ncbi:MAG: S8 family peptidase [Lachnospiraceae bacterium]
MNSQKIENLLNLSLDASTAEREKSLELDVGYSPIDQKWDVIVKYSGQLNFPSESEIQVVKLQNEYAIITIKETLLPFLTQIPQVEYIEKPKRLFFEVANARRVSCITSVQTTRLSLLGKGVLVAILDSGIDYTNSDFRNADGTTRIRNLWDQTIPGDPPSDYIIGTEYTQSQLNTALSKSTRFQRMQLVPSIDVSGHGTAVAGIAAGNGNESNKEYVGVAPESELLIVKLGSPRKDGFPRTTELMQALDYVVKKALEYQLPIAVNISFGNTYGSHDGTSLLERFIDDLSNFWKSVICIGTGNEADSSGHTFGILKENQEDIISLAIQEREPTINVQIWKSYSDIIDISLITPSGARIGPIQEVLGSQRFLVGDTELLLYYGKPSPYSPAQEIFIDFLPRTSYITNGEWRIILTPRKIVTGKYQLWLPSAGVLNIGTGFSFPTPYTTLTIPSTAQRVISVGAYDALTFTYGNFSGRGSIGTGFLQKPDLTAPGVNIIAPRVGGGYASFTGTSFATPMVTGSAALLMEWGIVNGNDMYLYGEKVKAYLRRGAKELPGFDRYPNPQVGYGALCVKDSLPI